MVPAYAGVILTTAQSRADTGGGSRIRGGDPKWVKFKESKNKFFIDKGDYYDELKAVKGSPPRMREPLPSLPS